VRPASRWLVADFVSLDAAEAFVDVMHHLDTAPHMPAPVLVAHDEQQTRDLAVTALRAAFLEVVGFEDPMAALDAIRNRLPWPGPGHVRGIPTGQTARRGFGA
jgi:hypothetical protein